MAPTLHEIAARHGFTDAAAAAALDALRHGGGMAQFDHPELGGHGQWMSGMVMLGRMGDETLKARVARLFADLLPLTHEGTAAEMGNMEPMKPMKPMEPMKPIEADRMDAPTEWGEPSSTGAQNNIRYAFYPKPRRLVVERDGQRIVYDTADHAINDVAQDHSDRRAGQLVFTSQHGPVSLDSLDIVVG